MYTLLAFLVLAACTFGAAFLAAAPLPVSIPIAVVIAALLVITERRLARRAR